VAARVSFWRRKIVDPVVALLRQGVTPEKMALGLALGVVLGVTPVIGSTTILCMAAALCLRLNLAAIQLVNYLMLPVQLMLLIPFMRAGEWLFGAARNPVTLERIRELIGASVWNAIATLWTSTMHALAAWAILGLIAIFPIYMVLLRSMRRIAQIQIRVTLTVNE
jgi:uncharacterized protein (DUF2062 family)